MPYHRYEGFQAYQNDDGVTWHILVVAGEGGFIIADQIPSQEDAEWIVKTLNDAIHQKTN